MTLSEIAKKRAEVRAGSPASKITLFPGATAVTPLNDLSLAEFMGDVISGRWSEEIKAVRLAVERGDMARATDMKRRLWAVTLSGTMTSRAKNAEVRHRGHSGWMQADFDGKDNPALIQVEAREFLAADPHVGAVFVGPSGTGIKAVVRIDPEKHLESFQAAETYFLEKYALKIDRACKDRERLCFVSHDPLAWMRPGETKILPAAKVEKKKAQPARAQEELPWEEMDIEDARAALAYIPKRPDYADWMRISSAVFAALPMAAGIAVLNEWSPEEKEGEYEKKWRNRLKDIHPGTLVWYAKEHGFDPKKYYARKRWMGTMKFPSRVVGARENPWGDPPQPPRTDHPELNPDDDRDARIREALKCGQRGDSRLFRSERGVDFAFDPAARVWRRYDESTGLWEKDYSRGTVLDVSNVCLRAYDDLAKAISQDMRDRPPATKNDQRIAEIETLMARMKQLNAGAYIKQVAELASMEPGGSRPAPEYDRGRHLLALANGVFDFSQMRLLQPRRGDLITMASPAAYVDGAKCPQFDAFLHRAFGGDEELIAYWWRIVGYSLTGYVDHDALFFCYGEGANGKSTSFLVLRMLMGDALSSVVNVQTVLGNGQDAAADYRKAALEGKRMVITDELPAGKQLNESMVKALLGGEDIQARRPYEQPYCFSPTHKIWMVGNHKPRIAGTDHGIWRRIHLIPWIHTVPPEERRPRHELLAIFRAELSGILYRAIEGYDDFLARNGRLEPPQAVMDATAEYRREEDAFSTFLEETIEPVPEARILVRELFDTYRKWCEATGENQTIQTQSKMTRALQKAAKYDVRHGAQRASTIHGWAYRGAE